MHKRKSCRHGALSLEIKAIHDDLARVTEIHQQCFTQGRSTSEIIEEKHLSTEMMPPY